MWRAHIFHCVADPHVRGSNVIYCVVNPQVMGMKATNTPVIYGCLTVDGE